MARFGRSQPFRPLIQGLQAGASADVTVALTGISATAAIGALGVALALGLSGVSATATAGTVTSSRSVALTGASVNGSVGTVTSSRTIALSGLTATGAVGTLTAGSGVTVALTGVSATGSVGTLAHGRTVALTGVSATGAVGTMTSAAALIPTTSRDAATISLNGAWTWFNDPRAVYDSVSDTLFYGAIRSNGAVDVYSWDFTRRLSLQGTPRTAVLEADDHDNPALCVLTDGTILTAYSQHNGDSYSARSSNPRDIRTWATPVALASGGTDDAYAHLMQMGDTANTVYWFFRRFTGTLEMKRYFRTSTNGGASWNTAVEFVSLTGQRPYVIAQQNGANRVDFLVTDGLPAAAEAATNSVYHFYMLVASDGTRTYFKSDGTALGNDSNLPLAPSSLTKIYDGATSYGWIWSLAILGGNPVVNYTTFDTSDAVHHYFQARWNGSAWQSDEITTGGTTATADNIGGAAESTYSAGIAQDPNDVDVVYLSREYGANDFRLEKWTQSGTFPSGTWAKTTDLSGNTGTVNARPYCPRGLSPTRVLWFEGSYTTYTSFLTKLRMDPAPSWRAAKAAVPVWTPAYAPSGVQAYFLLNEGSGTTVTDLVNARNGSVTGSPAWNAGDAGDFGPYLSGFTTADYVNIDALAAAINPTGYPVWIIVLWKTTDGVGVTDQWPVGIGLAASNNPLFGPLTNSGAPTTIGAFWRDTALAGPKVTATAADATDGQYHVQYVIKRAAGDWKLRFDGHGVNQDLTTTGAVTFDRGAIGALRRAAVAQPFAGEVHAVLVGWGAEPDTYGIALDLLHGQFAGTFSTDVTLTGVSATGAVGTLTPATAKALTGLSATGTVGTLAPSLTVALTGVSATGAVGTMTGSVPGAFQPWWARHVNAIVNSQ